MRQAPAPATHQRGIALLTAIVLFAIATVLAATITYNKAMAARRAAATFALDQALQAGLAAEALASLALETSAKNNSSQTLPTQPWAQTFGPVEIEDTGVWVAGQLEDLQSRFNLNSLVVFDQAANAFVADPGTMKEFQQLLQSLDLEAKWANLIVDWIDTDIAPNGPDGGEDSLYLTQTPAYRPPNTFITSSSELLALPGFGPERYAKLAPFVTALPNDSKVNICTAWGVVLDAVRADGQDEFKSNDPTPNRDRNCFPERTAFLSGLRSADPQDKARVDSRIDENSSYFLLTSTVRIGTTEFVLYSVLFREQSGQVRALQRTFGSE
ncbi:MAG TPA: type II secretion system minor pseudopilin GspK [Steroidobacteraceae bacterium]|nr:type II secretion system minor pseudopilin GspK [Steroidobacteraceae bacterium]